MATVPTSNPEIVESSPPVPAGRAFVRRVTVKNYRSIAQCNVALGPLTFLLGRNGSGKSNFLDTLRFVADALRTSLDHAIRERGGIGEVRRRSAGHPKNFGISLGLRLPSGTEANYSFEVAAISGGQYVVRREACSFPNADGRFEVREGEVALLPQAPPASPDRLYLVNAAGLPQFRELYNSLSTMGFYNLVPDRMRELQAPDAGQLLARDGGNIASVVGQLAKSFPENKRRIEDYLAQVVPGVAGVDHKAVGPRETLEFRQKLLGAASPWRFLADNMSDGTLRALGVLVALLQPLGMRGLPIPLVGIEEPEIALHPGAAGVLRDCLRDAAEIRQVLVTSHSPDLLDGQGFDPSTVLAVSADGGQSLIAPLSAANREAIRDGLCTPGELLRQDLIEPQPAVAGTQMDLFEAHQSR